MPLPLVWLDGRLLPLDEARVSPLDRGFLFGDGAYEVIPVYGGRAYRFDAHMERLDRSLREIRMEPPLDRDGWLRAFGALVHGNGGGDLLLYAQVTRGVEPERNHVPQPGTRPTIFSVVGSITVTDSSSSVVTYSNPSFGPNIGQCGRTPFGNSSVPVTARVARSIARAHAWNSGGGASVRTATAAPAVSSSMRSSSSPASTGSPAGRNSRRTSKR